MYIGYIWPQQLIERNRARYQRLLHLSSQHNVVLFARGNQQINEEIVNSAQSVVRTPSFGNKYVEYLLYYLIVLGWLARERLTGQIDVVHTFPGPSSLVGLTAKVLLGVQWVADILDDPAVELDAMDGCRPVMKYIGYRIHVAALRQFLRLADVLFVIGWDPNVGLPKKITDEYNIAEDTVIPIPNGVDLSETTPQGGSSGKNRFKVVYLGSIQAIRGIDVLIEAVARAADDVPAIELHLIGHTRTQKDKQEIDEKIFSEGIRGHTVFSGNRVPHDEALAEIESADVCVLPLTNTVENYDYTLPIKLFEYLALGRPTIASNLVGTKQVITDGENGILVPSDDSKALARALVRVANDATLRHTLAENARESIREYDWSRIHDRVLTTYSEKL